MKLLRFKINDQNKILDEKLKEILWYKRYLLDKGKGQLTIN